jgi:transposase
VEELPARAAGQHETWTLARLASWLAQARGAAISPGRLSVLLRRHGCRWTRPARPPGGPSGAPG